MTAVPVFGWLEPYYGELIGLAFSLLGAGILSLFKPKVRLIFGQANNSLNHVTVPDPNNEGQSTSTEIYVEKFFLQNTGKQPASEVEFVLSDWPTNIRVWQPRNEKYVPAGNGNCIISIPRVAPGELVIIDCVYINMKAAWITSVKCSEALGKEVPFQTVRKFSRPVEVLFAIGFLCGFAFLIQVFARMIGFI